MNLLERNFVKSFTDELSNLNGTEFEYVCRPILSMILKEQVEHKGHNLYGKPVGYTADFLAENCKIIGQCGTEPVYFEDFSKPIKDIEKAIRNHPNCDKIYLFANQRGSGGRITLLHEEINEHKFDKTIIVYDSEKCVNVVLENINATKKIEEILEYLPKTKEYYKILPQSNRLPDFKSQYFERSEEQEILDHFEEHDFIQIYGVSGIGKTELSINLAHSLKNNFETIIWIEGEPIENDQFDLSSVHISRFNSTINLEFLLHRHKTLVIVDNLNEKVQSFIDLFTSNNYKKSKCIITSLQRNLTILESFNLSFLKNETAQKILNGITPKPNDGIVEVILNSVQGYPLVLRLIKSAVENNEFTWTEIVDEIELLRDFEDDKNKKLSERIIGKFLDTHSKELTVINILNKKIISRHFSEFVLGKTGVKALDKRSLINIQDSYYFSIHQLILDSIREKTNIDAHINFFNDKLLDYLNKFNEIKSISYYKFLLNHRQFIRVTYDNLPADNNLKKVILYAIIQSSDFFSQPDWIITEIKNLNLSPSKRFQDLLLFIEEQEIRLFQLKNKKEEYSKVSGEIIASLNSILSEVHDQNFQRVILHHIGKFYAKINHLVSAKKFFSEVLEIDKEADYASLQLARIDIKNRDFRKAEATIKNVLGKEINLDHQSLAILLSFYELIANRNLSELRTNFIDKNTDFFLKVLLSSIDTNFDHPYRVLEKLSGHLAYMVPEVYRAICEALPLPSNMESSNQLKLAYATINLAYFKLLKFSKDQIIKLDEKMNEAFLSSERYFLSVELENDYEKKKLHDLYIHNNLPEKAIEILSSFDNKENPFYFQNLCKAQRLMGEFEPSLRSIDIAIENGNELNRFYKAALLHDKAETLKAMNDKECISVLEAAIKLQTNPKTITFWQEKKQLWEEGLT